MKTVLALSIKDGTKHFSRVEYNSLTGYVLNFKVAKHGLVRKLPRHFGDYKTQRETTFPMDLLLNGHGVYSNAS